MSYKKGSERRPLFYLVCFLLKSSLQYYIIDCGSKPSTYVKKHLWFVEKKKKLRISLKYLWESKVLPQLCYKQPREFFKDLHLQNQHSCDL